MTIRAIDYGGIITLHVQDREVEAVDLLERVIIQITMDYGREIERMPLPDDDEYAASLIITLSQLGRALVRMRQGEDIAVERILEADSLPN